MKIVERNTPLPNQSKQKTSKPVLHANNNNCNLNDTVNVKITFQTIDTKLLFNSMVCNEVITRANCGDEYSIDILTKIREKIKNDIENYKGLIKYTAIMLKPFFLVAVTDLTLVGPMSI